MSPHSTLPRFYYGGHIPAGEEALVELSAEESHHLANVLRLKAGTLVDVFDASGVGYTAEVRDVRKGLARVQVRYAHEVTPRTRPVLNLAVAVLKRRAMDLMIEKLSELGVDNLQPLLTAHCVALGDVKPNSDPPERWERLTIAAAKQSGRNRPLNILSPTTLETWLARLRPPAHTVFAHFDADAVLLGDWLVGRSGVTDLPIWIVIGPEGGWSASEVVDFRDAGFNPVTLGELVLRAETAAIAAAAACRLLVKSPS